MKKVIQIISIAGLLLIIAPPVLFLNGKISQEQQNWLIFLGTLTWFVGAYFWLGKNQKATNGQD